MVFYKGVLQDKSRMFAVSLFMTGNYRRQPVDDDGGLLLEMFFLETRKLSAFPVSPRRCFDVVTTFLTSTTLLQPRNNVEWER